MARPKTSELLLSFRAETVTQLRFDFALTIITEQTEMRIETRFRLARRRGPAHMIDPERVRYADVLVTLHQTTVDGDGWEDGTLALRFSNGITVRVGPDSNYEAWTVNRPHGEKLVALPGGGVAVWDPRPGSNE